jgi:hypothetical protein
MPASLLSNRSFATTRAVLDEGFVRTAVCLLPEGVFRPFGGAAGRAVLLWLRRRDAARLPFADPPTRWATLSDPGYDPRSLALKPTSDDEIDALVSGTGWEELPAGAWRPDGASLHGRRMADVAQIRKEVALARGRVRRLDLGDVDPGTGEARPQEDADLAGRRRLRSGDVLVSRLRPERGNVTVVPPEDGTPTVGSPEWVVLDVPKGRHWVWLVARTEAWRSQLPVAAGQTRPRTTAEAVLETRVPWPGDLVERADALAARLLEERASLARQLEELQGAVAQFVAHRDEPALRSALEELEGEG